MSNSLSKKKLSQKSYNIYLNKLSGNNQKKTFKEKLFDNYKYNIPQFYINNLSQIKGFYNIQVNLKLFNEKYTMLKKILELNKNVLEVPSTNLELNTTKENNFIFKNVDFDKGNDFNYLIKNKKIFKNLSEYRSSMKIYNNNNSNLFIKVINEKIKIKEKKIFVNLYKDFNKFIKKILKYNYSIGLLGYKDIFSIPDDDDDENILKKKNKYILFTKEILNQNLENNNNTENSNILEEVLFNYTNLYNNYSYGKSIIKIKKNIENHCVNFHNLSKTLSEESYSNVYDLLNILIDQEYHLINFLLNFNDIEKYKKILKQDNKIRTNIKRNLANFSSYKDDYMKIIPKSTGNIDMFNIPDYNVEGFFKNNNSLNNN